MSNSSWPANVKKRPLSRTSPPTPVLSRWNRDACVPPSSASNATADASPPPSPAPSPSLPPAPPPALPSTLSLSLSRSRSLWRSLLLPLSSVPRRVCGATVAAVFVVAGVPGAAAAVAALRRASRRCFDLDDMAAFRAPSAPPVRVEKKKGRAPLSVHAPRWLLVPHRKLRRPQRRRNKKVREPPRPVATWSR